MMMSTQPVTKLASVDMNVISEKRTPSLTSRESFEETLNSQAYNEKKLSVMESIKSIDFDVNHTNQARKNARRASFLLGN